MSSEPFTLKPAPFVFLKAAALVIFAVPILSFAAAFLAGFEGWYATNVPDGLVTYGFFVSFLVAGLQFLALFVTFFAWYSRAYRVSKTEILAKTLMSFDMKVLALTQDITDVQLEQGKFGEMLDYGDLILTVAGFDEVFRLKHIPNPSYQASRIRRLIDPRDHASQDKERPVAELIAGGETQYVEFKASFVWDYRRQAANKDLNVPTLKNVSAFMNSTGGIMLIGVQDDGTVLGLDNDLQALRRQDLDGWENTFNMAFLKMIGAEYRQYLRLSFPKLDGKAICQLSIVPAPEPVYFTSKGEEHFYIRTGNSSQPLTMSQAAKYIQTHFAGD